MGFVRDPLAERTCRPVARFVRVGGVRFKGMDVYVRVEACGSCSAELGSGHVYCHRCGSRVIREGEGR